MAWKDGLKLRGAIVIRCLDSAEEGSVDVGRIAVAIATGNNAAVYSGGVAVPRNSSQQR